VSKEGRKKTPWWCRVFGHEPDRNSWDFDTQTTKCVSCKIPMRYIGGGFWQPNLDEVLDHVR